MAVFFSPDWLVRTEYIFFPQLPSGLRAPMKEEVQTVAVRGQYLETTWSQGREGLYSQALDWRLCTQAVPHFWCPSSSGPIPAYHFSGLLTPRRLQLGSEFLNTPPFNRKTSECPLSAGDKAEEGGAHTVLFFKPLSHTRVVII